VTHLALLAEIDERTDLIFERHDRVDAMKLEQIETIDRSLPCCSDAYNCTRRPTHGAEHIEVSHIEIDVPVRSSRQIAAEFPTMDPLASDVVINLIHTASMLADELRRRLRPHGISQTGFRILAILRIAGRPLSPVEIARRLRTTRGTVTGLLDSLEKRDLVRRNPHPNGLLGKVQTALLGLQRRPDGAGSASDPCDE